MKRERYFRDELRKLFIGYAIIPAVIFTLVCGFIFMAAMIYGKQRANAEQNAFAAGEWERVLTAYEAELEKLAARPELVAGNLDAAARVKVYEDFYAVSARMGYKADFYVLNRDREPVLGTEEQLPGFLRTEPGIQWGPYKLIEDRPGDTAVRLAGAWKGQGGSLVLGCAVQPSGSGAAEEPAGSGAAEEPAGRSAAKQPVGSVFITVDSSQFQPVLDRSDTQTILADKFGWVYVSNNYNFVDGNSQIRRELKGAGRFLSYDGHLYLVSRQPVYHRLFAVYTLSDLQNIVLSLTIGGTLIITALIGMTVWVLLSARKVTEKKTEDFYRILDVMEQARAGDLDSSIEIAGDNEFGIIADAYNEMIGSLKLQMENNRRMTELVAVSQNRQLESQFNPHFLYNTLENIRYMCKIEPAIAQKMIVSLSGLLRYSLDARKEEVTVREDLEHLEHYLTILKYRYNRRFSYRIEVETEAVDCRIPKLVLQPMIENAVKYGFGKQETLRVELKVYLHEGKLIMICRDDGVGMTPMVLKEITQLLAQEENTSRHSGLYNIHRRIGILYGHPYGVEVRSAEGHGTTLVVTLPVHREETVC